MSRFAPNLLKKYKLWPQWFAVLEVMMLSMSIGMTGGWASPYLAKLTSKNSSLPITEAEASWVASILSIGRICGSILGAIFVEVLGSKTSLLLSGIPQAASWVLLIIANSVEWIYAARTLAGVALGIYFCSFPLYIGEISEPRIRGALVALCSNGMPIGGLIGSLMGPYLSMAEFSYTSLVPTMLFLFIFLLLPSSPHYLVRSEKMEKAAKSIQWYSQDADVDAELLALKNFIEANGKKQPFWKLLKEFIVPKNRRALILTNVLFLFMQLSGLYSIIFYLEIIMIRAQVTAVQPASVVIMLSATGMVSGWFGMYFIDKYGRRVLLCTSSAGVAVAMTLLGLHFMLLDLGYDPQLLQWIAITSLLLYQLSLYIGIVMVPPTILSELFSPNIKSTASAITNINSGLFSFVSSKTYQPMVDVLTEKYVFWIYGVFVLLLIIYTIFKIPETKGKSLQEIQEILAKT
ncbi:facilitated trehalose transporter Tret1 [Cephus cinctus]|uniref:Facilitated trehalose transporter Tret1 n=1 Tax=Cephus cinctus TaxID=211228 RepID=A0AAJ7BQZ7_CEPCN|nr:facilitated trehalose transporter Tret1 [Cephus cinctus]